MGLGPEIDDSCTVLANRSGRRVRPGQMLCQESTTTFLYTRGTEQIWYVAPAGEESVHTKTQRLTTACLGARRLELRAL